MAERERKRDTPQEITKITFQERSERFKKKKKKEFHLQAALVGNGTV